MNLTAIQSKVTRGNYVNVKKSVILSAEKEQPAENKVTGQQSVLCLICVYVFDFSHFYAFPDGWYTLGENSGLNLFFLVHHIIRMFSNA